MMLTIYNKLTKRYEKNFRNFKFDKHQKVIEVEVIEYCEKIKNSNKLHELNGIKSVAWLKLGEFSICRGASDELMDLFYEESFGGKE